MKTDEQLVEALNRVSNSIQDKLYRILLRLEERDRDSPFPPSNPLSFSAGSMERVALQREQEHLKEIYRDVGEALRAVGTREGLRVPVSPHDASQENDD